MKDLFGKKIKVGDRIACNRGGYMTWAIVIDVRERNLRAYVEGRYLQTIRCLSGCVVVNP